MRASHLGLRARADAGLIDHAPETDPAPIKAFTGIPNTACVHRGVYRWQAGDGLTRSGIATHDLYQAVMDVIIYHNPECGTSRNALAMIRNAGIEPHVIEYLKTPPARALLEQLIARAGISPRDLLRAKGTPYAELGLENPSLSDEQLLDAMMKHPVLINRPLVVSPRGVRLCRPSEEVLDLLPPQRADFVIEDGEQVVAADVSRIS